MNSAARIRWSLRAVLNKQTRKLREPNRAVSVQRQIPQNAALFFRPAERLSMVGPLLVYSWPLNSILKLAAEIERQDGIERDGSGERHNEASSLFADSRLAAPIVSLKFGPLKAGSASIKTAALSGKQSGISRLGYQTGPLPPPPPPPPQTGPRIKDKAR